MAAFLKYKINIILIMLVIFSVGAASIFLKSSSPVFIPGNEEILDILEKYFDCRCHAIISGDSDLLREQFDLNSKYGKWSYEHELKRMKYVRDWSTARDITLTGCDTKLKIFSIRGSESAVKIYLSDITRVTYKYNNRVSILQDEFCYGTRHTMSLVKKNDIWYVTVDWYSDPLDDSMPENEQTAVTINECIPEASATFKYNRAKAVEYADKYCGANYYLEAGYKYNKKYRNFSDMGGDCANFASQALSDSEGGGLRMGNGWLYKRGETSAAWVNAGAFTYNMLYSGRAKLAAKGKYQKVVNYTKSLSPGDIVCYERKGDIVHVSIVTAIDSAGVPLVNSHTNDRYHVPWDLGWNSENITFWFLRING